MGNKKLSTRVAEITVDTESTAVFDLAEDILSASPKIARSLKDHSLVIRKSKLYKSTFSALEGKGLQDLNPEQAMRIAAAIAFSIDGGGEDF